MTGVENVTEPHSSRPSTLRVRRHRQRRREGLPLLTVEMPEPAIETAIARGFLKPEETTQARSVIQSVYAAQLSDRALSWLTDCGDHYGTAHQRGCNPPPKSETGKIRFRGGGGGIRSS